MSRTTVHEDLQASPSAAGTEHARPNLHQHAREIQPFGKIARLPIALDETVCASSVGLLNQVLADTMVLRDMYKKHHWQVAGGDFLSVAPAVRQALRRAGGPGGCHRGAHSDFGRNQSRDGC